MKRGCACFLLFGVFCEINNCTVDLAERLGFDDGVQAVVFVVTLPLAVLVTPLIIRANQWALETMQGQRSTALDWWLD